MKKRKQGPLRSDIATDDPVRQPHLQFHDWSDAPHAARYYRGEIDRWSKVIKDSGITLE